MANGDEERPGVFAYRVGWVRGGGSGEHRMGVLGANFKSTSFLSIDAVGPVFLESITRVDHWWHLPKMAGRFVDKLETNFF